MEESFVITIDFSQTLPIRDAIFKVFIDTSKMTIVYELVEWMRWILSIKEPYSLLHKDSVINDFEDIRILSNYKNLRAVMRPPLDEFSEKLYSSLHNEIFYDWKGIKVPKIFMHRVKSIRQKLNTKFGELNQNQNNLKCENKNENCANDQKNNFSEQILYESEKHVLKDDKIDKQTREKLSDELKESTAKSTEIKKDVTCPGPENIKNFLMLPHHENNTSSNLIDNFKTAPVKDELNKNSAELAESKKKPLKRCSKPFSLGEIVESLRNENNKKTITEVTELTNNFTDVNNSFPVEEVCNDLKLSNRCDSFEADDFNVCPSKKRKRIRKRSKKKRQDSESPIGVSNTNSETEVSVWNFKKPFADVKPSHIRFSDVEEVKRENEESPNKDMEAHYTEFVDCRIEEVDFSKNLKSSVQSNSLPKTEGCLRVSGNKEPLPDGVSSSRANNNLIENKSSSNYCTQTDMNSKILNPKYESDFSKSDLRALMLLKEKFLTPVVIERF